jgi:hypothetical protein
MGWATAVGPTWAAAPYHTLMCGKHYQLCSLKAGSTTSCSTRYNASSSGQSLEALCGTATEENTQDQAPRPDFLRDSIISESISLAISVFLPNIVGLNQDAYSNTPEPLAQILNYLGNPEITDPGEVAQAPSPAEALLSLATCFALDVTDIVPFLSMAVSSTVIADHFKLITNHSRVRP